MPVPNRATVLREWPSYISNNVTSRVQNVRLDDDTILKTRFMTFSLDFL